MIGSSQRFYLAFLSSLPPLLLGHFAEGVGGELEAGVVGGLLRVAQPEVAARVADDGVAGRFSEGDVRVVLVRVHVQVVWLVEILRARGGSGARGFIPGGLGDGAQGVFHAVAHGVVRLCGRRGLEQLGVGVYGRFRGAVVIVFYSEALGEAPGLSL